MQTTGSPCPRRLRPHGAWQRALKLTVAVPRIGRAPPKVALGENANGAAPSSRPFALIAAVGVNARAALPLARTAAAQRRRRWAKLPGSRAARSRRTPELRRGCEAERGTADQCPGTLARRGRQEAERGDTRRHCAAGKGGRWSEGECRCSAGDRGAPHRRRGAEVEGRGARNRDVDAQGGCRGEGERSGARERPRTNRAKPLGAKATAALPANAPAALSVAAGLKARAAVPLISPSAASSVKPPTRPKLGSGAGSWPCVPAAVAAASKASVVAAAIKPVWVAAAVRRECKRSLPDTRRRTLEDALGDEHQVGAADQDG